MTKNNKNTKTRRPRPAPRNWKSIIMTSLLLLAMIAFIFSSIPNFSSSLSSKPRPVAGGSVPTLPSDNTRVSSTTFTKQGTLDIIRQDNPELLTLDIEVAQDDRKRAQGLMFRRHMEPHQGMLFIMDELKQQSFYMRNTYIPLDIIYLDEKRQIVSIQKNTTPLSEESLHSEGPAKYVLEVNAGYSDMHGLKKGDGIRFRLE